MSGGHTQGRLKTCNLYAEPEIRTTETDRHVVAVHGVHDLSDARRLAACWNACEGMPTEHVEELAGIGEGVMRLVVRADDWRRDKAELLAALQRLQRERNGDAWAQADAAIASAEGGA